MQTQSPFGFIHHGALGDQLLSVPVLRGLSRERPVFFWGRQPKLIERFCAVKAFQLDDFYKTSKSLGVAHWASVGPCDYLQLNGEVTELNTRSERAKPKWEEWGLALGVDILNVPHPFQHNISAAKVVVAPGSGSILKNWPTHYFAQIVQFFENHHLPFHIIFGPVEIERGLMQEWVSQFPAWSENFVVCDTVQKWLEYLTPDVFYVGCDSGPGHLAALCGCTGLIIFQNSDPRVWRPWSEHFTCVGAINAPPRVKEILMLIQAQL